MKDKFELGSSILGELKSLTINEDNSYLQRDDLNSNV